MTKPTEISRGNTRQDNKYQNKGQESKINMTKTNS